MSTGTAVRITWTDLPPEIRDRVEQIIGDRVVEARSQTGGFSPGTADRVRTAGGRRAFVKAVTPAINQESARLARQEILVTAALPEHAPTPGLLGAFDTGGWVVMVLEDIEGTHPRTPWVEHEIDQVTAALRELAAVLTPSPLPDAIEAADEYAGDFTGWDKLAADPPADLDPWAAAHLTELSAAAARGLVTLRGGTTLAHCDIRADNLLLRSDGRVVVIDWPWGCLGPEWFDRLGLGMNVLVNGGDPRSALGGIDPDTATDVIAGFTGYFRHQSRTPPPPGIPAVRAFQRAQADALLPWLRSRLR